MRRVVFIALALSAMLGPAASRADVGALARLEIEVDDAGWGEVDARDIEAVLHSAADILAPPSSRKAPIHIRVSHSEGCPVVLYERGPAGEYQVLLHADRTRWHLYAYEFAHEFCHVLSNYDRAGPEVARRNQWFEEAVCEAASLHVLERLGERWHAAPAAPIAPEHVASLHSFVRELDSRNKAQFPVAESIDDWLREHLTDLRADPYLRAENERVARAILPLFRAEPAAWRAIGHMNLHSGDPLASIEEFFRHWHAATPEQQRPFVARLARLLAGDAGFADQPPTAANETIPAVAR